MKLQIDFDKKVISLESDVNLWEFMSRVKVLLPHGTWKKYNIETNVHIEWREPYKVYFPVTEYPLINTQPIIYTAYNIDGYYTDISTHGTCCIDIH